MSSAGERGDPTYGSVVPMDQRRRAVASIAQPLDAEVLVDDAWRPGAVLGWQHDDSGRCAAQVRVSLPGGAQERRVGLDEVRLPEAPGAAASSPEPPAATVVMSRVELRGLLAAGLPARAVVRRRRHGSDLTAELPVVRCAESAGAPVPLRAAEAPGRHRAPGGRHRAGDDVAEGASPDLLTRPIRLDDVAAWSWSTSSAVAR